MSIKDNPYLVYQNLIIFLEKYHKHTITGEPLIEKKGTSITSQDKFSQMFRNLGYYRIDTDQATVFIIDAASKYGQKTAEFNSLTKHTDKNRDLIIVSNTTKKLGDITILPFYRFGCEIPLYNSAIHTLADDDEIRKYMEHKQLNHEDMLRIMISDPMVVWTRNAKVGKYMRIVRPSQNSGESVVYRRIV